MKCSKETLQAFLDGELQQSEIEAVRRHLGCCSACRQELSRLRLLWLELQQDEKIEIPPELPFIRQQAIARAKAIIQETKDTEDVEQRPGISLWEAQKLAWQPALAGVSRIPGPRQLGRLAKATGRELPAVFRGVSAVVGRIVGKWRDQR